MIRKLVIGAATVAVAVTPGTALAAGHKYKVGQKCSARYAKLYKAQHFSCVKGKLVKAKAA
jgi:hypothetical protein